MKSKHAITGYFHQRVAECKQCIRQFAKSHGEDDLHQLRVTIKKVKALLVLVKQSSADFNRKKYYKPFSNVFRQGAKIREAQIHLKIHQQSKTGLPAAESKRLKAVIATQSTRFTKKADAYIKAINKSAMKATAHLEALTNKQVENYMTENLAQLKNASAIEPHQFHEFRKELKQLMYNTKVLTPKQQLQFQIKIIYPAIDKLQDLIGQWHDNDLVLKSIVVLNISSTSKGVNGLRNKTAKQLRDIEKGLIQLRKSVEVL